MGEMLADVYPLTRRECMRGRQCRPGDIKAATQTVTVCQVIQHTMIREAQIEYEDFGVWCCNP